MNVFTRTFNKIFKSSNQAELDKTKNLISAINSKESSIKSLSDGEFKEKTLNLKRSVQEGNSLDNIIPGYCLRNYTICCVYCCVISTFAKIK